MLLQSLLWLALGASRPSFAEEPPPWTERTAYIEGDRFYAVGIATSYTRPHAREWALTRAGGELLSAGAFHAGGSYLYTPRHTQMIYETHDKETGKWTCYRLVWVPLDPRGSR